MMIEKQTRNKTLFKDIPIGTIFTVPLSNLIYFKNLDSRAINIIDNAVLLDSPLLFTDGHEVIPIKIEFVRYSES